MAWASGSVPSAAPGWVRGGRSTAKPGSGLSWRARVAAQPSLSCCGSGSKALVLCFAEQRCPHTSSHQGDGSSVWIWLLPSPCCSVLWLLLHEVPSTSRLSDQMSWHSTADPFNNNPETAALEGELGGRQGNRSSREPSKKTTKAKKAF